MADGGKDNYFKSYNSLTVQELMIKDRPRTEAYKEFLEKNVELIKGKVVLDVGAGTGILSLFAARSGAKKVYAVEASDIADLCLEIVKRNHYEGVVSVIKDAMENVHLPGKVDIIISEWMGFYLLHESMLESVLYARDEWLKEDGILLPSHATIYACPVNMIGYSRDNFEFWEEVYGFDFTPFQEQTVAAHLRTPTVICVKEEQLLSDAQQLIKIDLKTMNVSEIQEIEEKMAFKIRKTSILHGFATWFEVSFSPDIAMCEKLKGKQSELEENSSFDKTHHQVGDTLETDVNSGNHHVILNTSPLSAETHWKQTVCFLPVTMQVEEDEIIYSRISLCQDGANNRHYNITLEMLEDLDDTDDDVDEDDDDFEDDTSRHPIPCDCGSGRCKIISAIMEKYDAEQNELEMEAEFTEVSAEVQAAQSLDNDLYMNCEGVQNGDLSLKDDSN